MLRVFRLDSSLEFDVNPSNIMYIDVDSEREISKKYIKKEHLDKEFDTNFHTRLGNVYLPNYLVLKKRKKGIEPSTSDIDVVKKIPGKTKLPGKYWLDVKDRYIKFRYCSDILGETTDLEDPAVSTQHSKFLISIQSVYSEGEKLTVDQNEALLCSFSYYYPRPLARLMAIQEPTGILPENHPIVHPLSSMPYKQSVLYKNAWIFPYLHSKHATNFQESMRAMYRSCTSPMYFVYHSDGNVEMYVDSKRSLIRVHEIPAPIHSKFLIDILFSSEQEYRAPFSINLNEIGQYPYTEAWIPHYNELKGC